MEGVEFSLSEGAVAKWGIGTGIENFNMGSGSVQASNKYSVRINFANTKSNLYSNPTINSAPGIRRF